MANFIEPRKENIQIRNQKFRNIPVNIDVVQGINKTTKRFYSDGYWSVNAPAIEFVGTKVWWVFGEDKDNDCELCYKELMNSFGSVLNGSKAYILVKPLQEGENSPDMLLTTNADFAHRQYETGDYVVMHTLKIFNP
jgi:hypothetical protein